MKKLFYTVFITLIISLLTLSTKVTIVMADSEALMTDLVPVPTPQPDFLNGSIEDKRKWTKFKYNDLIAKTSSKYDLDPQLIYATIMTESEGEILAYRFEPRLNDASLCMGQILTSTARLLGFRGHPKEMYQPEVCIDLVGKYHRLMLDKHGELTAYQLASAYNTGSPRKKPIRGYWKRFSSYLNEA